MQEGKQEGTKVVFLGRTGRKSSFKLLTASLVLLQILFFQTFFRIMSIRILAGV